MTHDHPEAVEYEAAAPELERAAARPLTYTHFTDERIEQVLGGEPLTVEEREFLITDTPRFEECQPESEADLRALKDAALMRRCYHIWADYATGQI